MYSKKKYEELLSRYFPKFKKLLRIKTQVKFHVIKSTSRLATRAHKFSKTLKGLTMSDRKGNADVFLFYDNHHTERSALGTLFHELLHVRMHKLAGLVSFQYNMAHNEEERLVQALEDLFIRIYWDKRL